MKKKVFYLGLEALASRYTQQLSEQWMPATFAEFKNLEFIPVIGDSVPVEISVGNVLDAVGRGKYAMSQCSKLLDLIAKGEVTDNDVIFLQDFYTPGIDAVFYALDLYGLNPKFYSMLHAQSVDEYDFTWSMRGWLRSYERSIATRMSGIFVGSTIHREQLRASGFDCPIHVVSLPLHKKMVSDMVKNHQLKLFRDPTVVYASRFDKEKNPFFMMSVAREFLKNNPNANWLILHGGQEIRSSVPGAVDALKSLEIETEGRFRILSGISKVDYYTYLANSAVLFNSSLQDYVSWTILEGDTFGINIITPKFRSFPEFMPESNMYHPFNVDSALGKLQVAIDNPIRKDFGFADIADLGRRMEGYIVSNDVTNEINIWHEAEYCKYLLKTK